MRRALTVAALGVALVVGLSHLADATQSRPDPVPAKGTQVVVSVRTRAGLDADLAAASLWAACHPTVRGTQLTALTPLGQSRYRLDLLPGIGDQGRRRLIGCLEDATIERVMARVEAVQTPMGADIERPPSPLVTSVEAS